MSRTHDLSSAIRSIPTAWDKDRAHRRGGEIKVNIIGNHHVKSEIVMLSFGTRLSLNCQSPRSSHIECMAGSNGVQKIQGCKLK
jgi:hypothetical protein